MTFTEYRARCKQLGVKPLPASQCGPLITQHGGSDVDTDPPRDWQDVVLTLTAWSCLIVALLIAGGLVLGFASVKFGWNL